MATAAIDPLAPAATLPPVEVGSPYVFDIDIDGLAEPIVFDLRRLPDPVKLHLLKTATKNYVHNRVSTAEAKTKKANADWSLYEAAMQNDPLQSVVPKPTVERVTTDVQAIADGAINALVNDLLGRRSGGTGKKAKEKRDPLITQITRAVVADVYKKGTAADPAYKYPTAQKEVGSDGLAYLRTKLPEWLAKGGDEAGFNKVLETRYINPAKIMLGITLPKSIADAGDIL